MDFESLKTSSSGFDKLTKALEENLNPELLSHLLPGPALLAAHARATVSDHAHASALRLRDRRDAALWRAAAWNCQR